MRQRSMPQLAIAIGLLVILIAVLVLANRSSSRPNSGVFSVEAFGIVVNQRGTCVEVPSSNFLLESKGPTGVICTGGVVLGHKGQCVVFGENNFAPHFQAGHPTKMAICREDGLAPNRPKQHASTPAGRQQGPSSSANSATP